MHNPVGIVEEKKCRDARESIANLALVRPGENASWDIPAYLGQCAIFYPTFWPFPLIDLMAFSELELQKRLRDLPVKRDDESEDERHLFLHTNDDSTNSLTH